MLKTLRGEKEALNAGFTLMELIIVIAVLGMLIGMLLPRFSNYTDKAMGTRAGVDAKNILTIATAFNLDNDDEITFDELCAQTGIGRTFKGGKKLAQMGASPVFRYTYQRGGATVTADIFTETSEITYFIQGADGSGFGQGYLGVLHPLDPDTQAGRIAKALGF